MAKEPDYTRPPKFHPEVDFQDWRKKVGEWVATIKKAHDQGQDRALQTRFTLLGRIFYSEALPDAQKSLVDDEIAKKNIDLFNDCLLYTSPSPRDLSTSRMPSSA